MDHRRALPPQDTAVISSVASFCPSPCLSLDSFENPEAAIKEPTKKFPDAMEKRDRGKVSSVWERTDGFDMEQLPPPRSD